MLGIFAECGSQGGSSNYFWALALIAVAAVWFLGVFAIVRQAEPENRISLLMLFAFWVVIGVLCGTRFAFVEERGGILAIAVAGSILVGIAIWSRRPSLGWWPIMVGAMGTLTGPGLWILIVFWVILVEDLCLS